LKCKDLGRSPSFKPFEGGTAYCSGRFLAQREGLVFVAVLLSRFDVGLTPDFGGRVGEEVERQPFPRVEQMKPC
jgi:cytochrome P450